MKRATVAHILLAAALVLRSLAEVTGAWFFDDIVENGSFSCGNGHSVRPHVMCDGVDNCENNEDENVCSPGLFVCPQRSFTCHNKMRCVPVNWLCDGDDDCHDAVDGVSSDEKNCETTTEVGTTAATAAKTAEQTTTQRTPPPPVSTVAAEQPTGTTSPPGGCKVDQGEFPCLDGRCLLPVQVCDGRSDCTDGADEGRFCELVGRGMRQRQQHPAPTTEVATTEAATAAATAAKTAEQTTTRKTPPPPVSTVAAEQPTGTTSPPGGCKVDQGEFSCLDGRCLLPVQVCDGRSDCTDGADEGRFCELVGRGMRQRQQHPAPTTEVATTEAATAAATAAKTAEQTTTRKTPPPPVSSVAAEQPTGTTSPPGGCKVDQGEFPCLDGRCLLPVQVCDGRSDCTDGADEGRFCELVGRGMRQRQQQQQQQQQHQQQRSQREHGRHGWLVDFRLQLRMLFQPLLNSSGEIGRE